MSESPHLSLSMAWREAANRAFRMGPPGVLRSVQQVDSYPGEYSGDPDAHKLIPTTAAQGDAALVDAADAAVRVVLEHLTWHLRDMPSESVVRSLLSDLEQGELVVIVWCEKCGQRTTTLEANRRNFNQGLCACGGQLWPDGPRELKAAEGQAVNLERGADA